MLPSTQMTMMIVMMSNCFKAPIDWEECFIQTPLVSASFVPYIHFILLATM